MVSAGRFRGGSFNQRRLAENLRRSQPPDITTGDLFDAYERAEWSKSQSEALVGGLQQESIVPDWLEPIGDTGLYATPDEPVDPQDCDRYPNSPWCSSSGVDPIDLATLSPISTSLTFSANQDLTEFCVQVDASLFAIGLAPTHFCYRTPNARPLPPRPAPPAEPPPNYANVTPYVWTPVNFNTDPGCLYKPVTEHQTYTFDEFGRGGPGTFRSTNSSTPYYGSVFGYYTYAGYYGPRGRFSGLAWHLVIYYVHPEHGIDFGGFEYTFWSHPPYNFPMQPPVLKDLIPTGICPNIPRRHPAPPPEYTPRPSPPPQPHDPMPCCNTNEIEEMLRLIMLRLGTAQYPATVPKNIADKATDTESISNLTDLLAWTVKQMDALMGQFPVEIEVTDVDPTQDGNQTRKVTLPNLAEYAGEMYGLALRSAVNSDIHTNFLMRLAAEVVATKNAAIVTQDYARANASYLGYKANTVTRKVQYAFDVTKLDNLEAILSNSEKNVVGWQDEDENTVQAYLERLMFAAGIIKSVFFKPTGQVADLAKQLQNLLGVDENGNQKPIDQNDDAWRAFLQEINSSTGGFNRNSPTVPRVSDPTVSGETSLDVTLTGFDLISDVSNPDPDTA